MALFKIAKGTNATNLSNIKCKEGYCYVLEQNKTTHQPITEPNKRFYFYVDTSDSERAIAAASYADRYPVKIVTWS